MELVFKRCKIMKSLRVIVRFSATLLIAFALFCCSKEEGQPQVKILHYSVSVQNDGPSTKVTVDDARNQLFQEGDILRITGIGISGDLTLKSGAGTNSASFSGDLIYTGGGNPSDDLELNAILISLTDKLNQEGGSYLNAVVPSFAKAVEQYSYLTGQSTYGEKNFNLSQGSAFIKFDLYAYGFADGEYTASITTSDNSYTASGSIMVTDEKAVFAAAFGDGVTLTNPMVTIENGEKIVYRPFGSKTSPTITLVSNKVNTVTDKAPEVGNVYYSDGTWTGNRQTPSAIPLGLIVYVNEGSESIAPATVPDVEAFADGVTEKDNGFGHALVIAMKDCALPTNGIRWSTSTTRVTDPVFENGWFDHPENKRDQLTLSSYNGIGKTDYMVTDPDVFLAGAVIREYSPYAESTTHASEWFMPTITQWIASFMGLGNSRDTFLYPLDGTSYYSSSIYDNFYSKVGTGGFEMPLNIYDNWRYESMSGKNYNWYYYWSSTQNLENRAICIAFRDGGGVKGVGLAHHEKARTRAYNPLTGDLAVAGRSVRAFLAF